MNDLNSSEIKSLLLNENFKKKYTIVIAFVMLHIIVYLVKILQWTYVYWLSADNDFIYSIE